MTNPKPGARAPKKTAKKNKDTAALTVPPTQLDDAPLLAAEESLGALNEPEDAAAAPRPTPNQSVSHRKPAAPDAPLPEPPETPAAAADSAAPPAPAEHEPLRVPRGAFLVLRKSGGLKFSTREVVVFPDGRISFDARGVPQKEYNRLRRVLNDAQVLGLRKLLDQANFWKTESVGAQNPDAFAYEVAARLGQRANSIEVFDGSIPERIKPLLERLEKLLPENIE